MNTRVNNLGRLLDACISVLSNVTGLLAALMVVLMTALITLEVIMRSLFSVSTMIAEEVGAYLLVVIVYLGLSYALRTDGHIRIRFAFDHLPPKVQNALELLTSILNLMVSVIFAQWGWHLVWDSYSHGEYAITWLRTPLFIPQLFISFGLSILVLEALACLFKIILINISPHSGITLEQ